MGSGSLETLHCNTPPVMLLDGAWIIFHFLSKDDRRVVEERFWVIGHGSLVLKRWHVGFDPRHKKLDKRHLWVILPGFPIHFWNIKGFMGITNSTRKFIMMEDNQLLGFSRKNPRILVEISVGDRLSEDVEVRWEGYYFIQHMDY